MVSLIVLLVFAVLFVGAGFAWGYWAGRRRGQRDSQQGFPVVPSTSTEPGRPS